MMVRAASPELAVEGPTQFDAAVDMDVAAIKLGGRKSSVAGRATVCIFPDLNTGEHLMSHDEISLHRQMIVMRQTYSILMTRYAYAMLKGRKVCAMLMTTKAQSN